LAGRMGVLYDWRVEEEGERWGTENYRDKDGRTRTRRVLRSGWTTVAGTEHTQGFYLKDEFGFLWVHPRGADLETLDLFSETVSRHDDLYFAKGPSDEIADSTGRRRFRESGLPVGTQLFVRGRATERSDIVAPQIVQDPKADMFIITPRKESEVSAGKDTTFIPWNIFGTACMGALCLVLVGASRPEHAPFAFVAGAMLYFVMLPAGWSWLVPDTPRRPAPPRPPPRLAHPRAPHAAPPPYSLPPPTPAPSPPARGPGPAP